MPKLPTYLTAREAAARLGVSLATLYRLVASGDLPAYKVGQQLRFDPDEVRASLKRERAAL